MARNILLLRSLTRGNLKFHLYDFGSEGTMRYRLMKHDTIKNRYDTFTASEKGEFERTMDGEWVKWKEPHGHQVMKENENVGIAEVVFQRLPPHPMTPESLKGEIVKDIPDVTKE